MTNLPCSNSFYSRMFIARLLIITQFIGLTFSTSIFGQSFTDISAALTGVSSSSVAWGDYDNDGDLDILLTGTADGTNGVAEIYRNDGGNFVKTSVLFGVLNGSVAWGDYDNDNNLDILLTGRNSSGYFSKIYRNDGRNFIDTVASIIGVGSSAVAWGDYDNDGDLDILLTGTNDGSTSISKIYRNDGGNFADIAAPLVGVDQGSATWVDYDNDGDLDVFLAGRNSNNNQGVSQLYRNDNGTFVEINTLIQKVYPSSADWGDYDNDGNLDILHSGDQVSPTAKVYRNNGGSFEDRFAPLTGVRNGSVAWDDYDNDGDLDILLTGRTESNSVLTKIYQNNGGGNFSAQSINLPNLWLSSIGRGDYDNDGDLDLVLTGSDGTNRIAKIFQNNVGTPNTVPTSPLGLSSSIVSANVITLSWNKATDNQTPQNGLSYNLRVGTTPGGSQIVSPMADVNTGYRKIPKIGNTSHRNSWTIKKLPNGKYYWSVQAIDNAFAGSTFAKEDSFTIGNRPPVVANTIPNQTLMHGGASFTRNLNASPVIFSDPDGDALTYAASSTTPSKATAAISGSMLTVTPVAAGSATITVTANDNKNGSVSTAFTVTVNRPPVVANPIPNQTITVGGTSFTRNLDASPVVFSDPDGDSLTYTASSSDTIKAEAKISGNNLTVIPLVGGSAIISITANDSKGGTKSTMFTVTINRPPMVNNAIPNQTLSIGGPPFSNNLNAVPVVFSDLDGDELTYSASSSALDIASASTSGSILTVAVVAAGNAIITVMANDNKGGTVSTTFAVTVKDLSPPVIKSFPRPTTTSINTSVEISIPINSITDPGGVKKVDLCYRISGQSFTCTEMTPENGNYKASIPASGITEKGVEFYLRAEDNANNSTPTSNYSIQVNIPNGITRPEPQPSGSSISAYKLFSIPLDLDNPSASKFVEANPSLGAYDRQVWRMYDFDHVTQKFVEFPNFSLSPDKGYMLIIDKPNIQLKTGSGKTFKTAEPHEISRLPKGWSIIGNPFNYDIPRDSVAITNGNLEIYALANGGWSLNTTGLKAWEGYAVWVSEPSTLLIKAGKAGLSQGNILFDIANSDEKNWLIQVKAKLNNTEDTFNFLGQNESAINHYDRMDLHKAPAFGGDIRLEIAHPDWQEQAQEAFTTDIRQVNLAGQFYDFDVFTTTTEGVGALSFTGIDKLPSDYLVYLVDKAGKTSINLRNNSEHHFAPVSSGKKSFRLLVGTRELVKQNSEGVEVFPTQYRLAQNYPNPFNPATTIQYSLPERGLVQLEIFDLLGQKVRTLIHANQSADNYSVVWDGKNDAGVIVPSGVYFYRLHTGRFEQSKKLILMR